MRWCIGVVLLFHWLGFITSIDQCFKENLNNPDVSIVYVRTEHCFVFSISYFMANTLVTYTFLSKTSTICNWYSNTNVNCQVNRQRKQVLHLKRQLN